jgi:hypothetical protein
VLVADAVREAQMTQKITVTLEDDLDGGPADEMVQFGIDSADYEIDLGKRHASAFRHKLAPFIEHARKAGKGHPRGSNDDSHLRYGVLVLHRARHSIRVEPVRACMPPLVMVEGGPNARA